MSTANLILGSTRATNVAGGSTPWTLASAFRLAQFVHSTLAILAANLLTESFGTRLAAAFANMA
jgi:hypothetical protein